VSGKTGDSQLSSDAGGRYSKSSGESRAASSEVVLIPKGDTLMVAHTTSWRKSIWAESMILFVSESKTLYAENEGRTPGRHTSRLRVLVSYADAPK
jgi:hypothetical protein